MDRKNHKPKHRDEKREQIEMMFRSTGTEPRGGIITWLLRLWAKDTGEAQARGVHIREIVRKENSNGN